MKMGQWTDVKQYVTSQSGNSVMSDLTQDTLYRLHETAAPEGYLLPDPTPYHYFVISKNAYTLPTDSGFVEGRDSFALYKLGENESFGSFYYYCNNARNPDYVKEGDLLVKKAWKNFDGTDITDTSKLPEIVVTLTKHVTNPGHRILLQCDGQQQSSLPRTSTMAVVFYLLLARISTMHGPAVYPRCDHNQHRRNST